MANSWNYSLILLVTIWLHSTNDHQFFFQRNTHTDSHSCFRNIFFNSHDRYKIDQVINEMGVNASESDIEILKQVCTAVSIRAARLAAAGIAGIVKV